MVVYGSKRETIILLFFQYLKRVSIALITVSALFVSSGFAANTYTITYDYNGGALEAGVTNPSEYTDDMSDDIILNNPVKTDYIFAGWCSVNSEYCDPHNIVTIIPVGTTGNIDLYATWIYDAQQYCDEGHVAVFHIYDNNVSSWCNGCPAGSYCLGGTFKLSDIYDPQHDYFEIGAQACSGNTYSNYGQSSCAPCPAGTNANTKHTACACQTNYIFNRSIDECVAYDAITCPADNERDGRYAVFENFDEISGKYLSFYCTSCVPGYYCDGGVYSYNTLHQIWWNWDAYSQGYTDWGFHIGVGAARCSGNTYSQYWAVSCKQCPVGAPSNVYNTTCLCGAGNFFSTNDNVCKSCNGYETDPSGNQCVCTGDTFWSWNLERCISSLVATIQPGRYVNFYDGGWWDSRCPAGYWCPGGTFERSDADENGIAGRNACGENQYSVRGSSLLSACKSCPTSEQNGTGILISLDDYDGAVCGCVSGFDWNLNEAACIYSCPESMIPHYNELTEQYECLQNIECPSNSVQNYNPNHYVNGGQFISLLGEAFMDLNNDGQITVDDCVAGFHYGSFWQPLYTIDTSTLQPNDDWYYFKDLIQWAQFQATNDNTNSLNTNVWADAVFCKYDTVSGKYNKDCSEPLLVCGEDDFTGSLNFEDFFTVSGLISTVPALANTGVDTNNPNWKRDLFVTGNTLTSVSVPIDNICAIFCMFGYEYNPSVNDCVPKEYQCDDGEYLKLNTDYQMLTIETCEPNHYCVAGTWTINDIDSTTNTAGMFACPGNSTSAGGSSFCDCSPGYSWNSTIYDCDANIININWAGISEPGAAAMCVYDGDLITPDTAPVVAEHVFLGWFYQTISGGGG